MFKMSSKKLFHFIPQYDIYEHLIQKKRRYFNNYVIVGIHPNVIVGGVITINYIICKNLPLLMARVR